MYEYIKGVFIGINKDYVIIENNDIGYKIFVSGSTLSNMPPVNEKIKLFLQQIIREDFVGLYGFLTKEELEMFNLLLTINGVGAKAALSLLSISNTTNLKYAIITGDEKTIVRAPGIGKKIAQRIILELKDKLKADDLLQNEEVIKGIEEGEGYSPSTVREAFEALVSLGYTEKEAEKVLEKVDKNDSIENIIKNSLKQLMS